MTGHGLWIIPLFPLLGAVFAYRWGLKRPALAGIIATSASALAFLQTIVLFMSLPAGGRFEDSLFTWFTVGDFSIDFALRFDSLTAVMCLVVTGIGSLIHLYSTAYMAEDPSVPRFFAYLNLFMFSMLILVLGANLLMLFIGWEGVGLCSYLLIGFWHENLAYAAAGRKAFLVNRIGDAGFLLGIFLLLQHFGTVDFVALEAKIAAVQIVDVDLMTLIALCLFVGATGKSAQIPLFVWLPDAMAGPTPVSALIHAATMVTAGVYLLARLGFLFTLAPLALAVVCLVAVVTAFVAGTTALTQNDIKKVLAYSTVSQLGFMFIAAAAGAYWVAIFHVVTHAFFKACLFLGAGSVIHGCHHEQDMRHMGGLLKKMPITGVTYLISVLAIAGIAPFAGYYSKHAILEALAHNQNAYLAEVTPWLVTAVSFTAFVTAFYMTRSFVLTFLGEYRGHAHPHESPLRMTIPLIVLAALALIGGLWLRGALPEYLGVAVHGHHGGLLDDLLHSWIGFAGVGLALLLYLQLPAIPGKIYQGLAPVGRILTAKYYVDELYGWLIVRPLERAAKLLWRFFDQLLIDGVVNGTAACAEVAGEALRLTQTGQIRTYALYMFMGSVFLIVFYLAL